ncbi:MAG: hypothetical protein KBT75_15890 [Oleispira antarctica]|nr:hypothetical protein [Oleispira antarctica]MBQ0791640.1 hypothetical protein [Oleispira antarctica]
MSQEVKVGNMTSASSHDVDRDEIDLVDLIKSIWSQRGLVLGIMLLVMLAVLSFHSYKASFSTANRIDYPISLSFLADSKPSYPNGTSFSPRDLITGRVLQNAISTSGLELTLESLEKSITVAPSNSLLKKSEDKLSVLLADAKTSEEIRLAAEASLKYLKDAGSGYVTVSLNIQELGVNSQQGSFLLQIVVDEWATLSLERGLMNVDIARPLVPFTIIEGSNLIDNYDQASNYLNSLTTAVLQLSELSGSSSIVVNRMSIEDVQRRLTALGDRDIGPLREFAYSNSSSLAESDSAIQVRLFARQRLLDLEHARLTKLISSYDLALVQLGSDNQQQQYSGSSNQNSQGNSGQFDQSFLDSLLQLGTRLGAVDTRKQLFERRITAVEELLLLEKEISILLGTSSSNVMKIDPEVILKGALVTIEKDLNEIQQNIGQFVDAIRELTLSSHTQVYSANSAPQVRGGFMELAPRFALFIVLGSILGLFLGIFVALIRSALINSK